MGNKGSTLQNQMADLISSMPLNNNSSPSAGISEFNSYDPKNPLKSLPQDLVPIPFKSPNMAGGMFSSSSGTLFAGPRSISSSSSGLQLSSNSSSGFNYLQDGKTGSPLSSSANMSATALLQKAAQMGATASNNINSPMMQKSFVTSMAGSDQLSPVRPSSYGGMQQPTNPNSYDHLHFQPDQSPLVGSRFFQQKAHQEIQSLFDPIPGPASVNSDISMFGNMFIAGDQNTAFLKNVENEDSSSPSSLAQGRTVMGRRATGPSRFGGNVGAGSGCTDMTTVDFLGIGGSRPVNLQEQQLELAAMNQQRMQVMDSFQQPISHGEQAIDKSPYGIYE